MIDPTPTRPHMPGYGIASGDDGLLTWAWAEDRLRRSHDYWLATARPDGRPHVMPVWGAWFSGSVWFSSDVGSRKGRNLATSPRCSVTTDDALEPVIVEGDAELVTNREVIAEFAANLRQKYEAEWQPTYTVDFFDATLGGGGTYRVRPTWAFGLVSAEFASTPTRWTF